MMRGSEAVRRDVVRRVEAYDSNAVGVPRKWSPSVTYSYSVE